MVELEGVVVQLPGFRLGKLDLMVASGEFAILLGPTGAGKSLVLEAIAGIVPVARGVIRVNGSDVTQQPPEKRGIGIVYQDFALFPHLNVTHNILYGRRYQKKKERLHHNRIRELMDATGIGHLRRRNVTTLSGGEKQRVALVRALSVKPSVLLLDEPLSALDRETRDDIRKLLKTLHRETGTTFLMVTHDFTEALFLGQRAAVINCGRIEQTGPVQEIFSRPRNPFVARFVGIPNVFSARFRGICAHFGDCCLTLNALPDSGASHIAVRPEDVRIHRNSGSVLQTANLLAGEITDVADLGAYGEVTLQTSGIILKATLPRRDLLALFASGNGEVRAEIPPEAIHVF